MAIYFFPIRTAVITFLAVASFIMIPFLAWQYRKYGAISLLRTGILFSFVFYLLSAYYLVILPLPDPATLAPHTNIRQFMNLIPFQFVFDFIRETSFQPTSIGSILPALLEPVFIQPVFNIALTIPFGVYLAYYFKQNLKKVLLFSFLLSLFFELTQLSALYGLYPRPYRLFDVDDLMLNTLGGLVGYGLFQKFLFFLPSKDKMDERAAEKRDRVGYLRRGIALFIDYTIIGIAAGALVNIMHGSLGISSGLLSAFVLPLLLFAYFMLSQRFWGKSLGQRSVRIQVSAAKESGGQAFFVRHGLFSFIVLLFSLLSFFVETTYYNGVFAFFYLVLLLALGIDFFVSLKKEQQFFFERLSQTKYNSTK